jgi:hypothetical protein
VPTKTFWPEKTDLVRVSLRRFTYSVQPGSPNQELAENCPKTKWGHNASRVIEAAEEVTPASKWIRPLEDQCYEVISAPRDDPRWPVVCDACGKLFEDGAQWQTNAYPLYRGAPDGNLYTNRDMPPGAMYDADWLHGKWRWWVGDDGISLVVVLPNRREWMPDTRASNCTMPTDDVHRCWCRHGDPRLANLTVDKVGVTCQAGGGSILAGDYHGFLQNGVLT